MTPDAALEAVRLAGFTSVEAHALVTKSRALGLDVLDVVMAIKRPYIFDFDLGGILAPLDVTGAEASSLITEYSRRRPRTRREQLLALARVCGEVECPPIRSRVCVDVLEVLSRTQPPLLETRPMTFDEAFAASTKARLPWMQSTSGGVNYAHARRLGDGTFVDHFNRPWSPSTEQRESVDWQPVADPALKAAHPGGDCAECGGMLDHDEARPVVVGLVSCSKAKLDQPAPARELYAPSYVFRLSREYVEHHCDAWWILSAEHGLVHPTTVIAPYDKTLPKMPKRERVAWAVQVCETLRKRYEGVHVRFILLAGQLYALAVDGLDAEVDQPLAGLGTGHRRRWLAQHRA